MNINIIGTASTGAIVAEITIDDLRSAELPTIQVVRGSVWPAEQAGQLVIDYKAGKYIPPIILVHYKNADGNDVYQLIDGQQRFLTLSAAVEKGLIDGNSPVLCTIIEGDASEYFRRLNIGVPVGKAIVSTVQLGEAGETVLTLAQHPIWDNMGLSNLQRQRGAHADMSLAILAICAGWVDVESTSKAAITYVKEHLDECKDALGKAQAYLDDLDAGLAVYRAYVSKYGKNNKATVTARHLLADARKKNLLYTVTDAVINGGLSVRVALAALTHRERLEVPLTYTYEVNGKERKGRAKWTVGGGSSGSNADFVQRQRVIAAVAADLTAADLMNGLTEAPKPEEAAQVSDVDAAAVAALLGEG